MRSISYERQYDFSESAPTPYTKRLKKQVTIRLGVDVIMYFKGMAEETGIPYQRLINLYLQDCARKQTLSRVWSEISL